MNRSAAFRRTCLIGYWLLIFVLTHTPDIDGLPGARWLMHPFDFAVHACVYGGWAALWWWVLAARGSRVRGRMAAGILAGGAAYGIFDEMTQALVSREPSVGDFLADVAGVALVLLFFGWWFNRRLRGQID